MRPPMWNRYLLGFVWGLLALGFCLGADKDPDKKEKAAPLAPELAAKIAAFPNWVSLLRDEGVRTELKLSDSQKKDLDKELSKVDFPFWQARDNTKPEVSKKKGECFDYLDLALARVLTVPQKRRADGILIQVVGWPALVIPQVGDKVGIKSPLRKQIQAIVDAERIKKKEGPLSSESQAKIKRLLTDGQIRALTQLTGATFDSSKVVFRPCLAPAIGEKEEWVNSKPLKRSDMEGKVVVLHFWAYG